MCAAHTVHAPHRTATHLLTPALPFYIVPLQLTDAASHPRRTTSPDENIDSKALYVLLVPDALPCDTDGQHCNLFDILSLQRHSHDSSAPVANLTARLDDELRAFNQPVLPPIDKALRSLFAAYELICWVATASDFCIDRYVVNVTSLLKRSAKKSAKQVTRPLAPPS